MLPRPLTSLLLCAVLFSSVLCHADDEAPGYKPPPERPSAEALVVVEDQQILDECDADKICIEGNLYNAGAKMARRLKLRVEVGGGKYAKPRTSFFTPLEATALDAGARMGFSATIDRKIAYKGAKGENKTIEAGKYNVKLVPVWALDNKIEIKKKTKKK
jgi:hypothetical protein